jgi:transposase InsO family protein
MRERQKHKATGHKQAQSIWTKRILQRIYVDLVRLFRIEARGYRYILVVMDDFSRYCTAIPLKNKVGSEVGSYSTYEIYRTT